MIKSDLWSQKQDSEEFSKIDAILNSSQDILMLNIDHFLYLDNFIINLHIQHSFLNKLKTNSIKKINFSLKKTYMKL